MPHVKTVIDGVEYPSVTQIIGAKPKPWLIAWQDKWGVLAVRKAMIAAAIGTEFHRCVEQWLDTGTYTVGSPTADGIAIPSTKRRVEGMLASWLKWAFSVGISVIGTERRVISHKHRYSGTADAYGEDAGKRLLIDWKTGDRLYPEVEVQTSAYNEALAEEIGWKADEGLAVNTSKQKPDFRVTVKRFKLGKRLFNKFLKLRKDFDALEAK